MRYSRLLETWLMDFTVTSRSRMIILAFKSRKHPVQSYTTRFTNGNIAVKENHIQLPKLGLVRYAKSREIEGKILSATIRLAPSGKWFVAVVCEAEIQPLPVTEGMLGIDVGIKQLAVTSDGLAMENPRHTMRYEAKLATLPPSIFRLHFNWQEGAVPMAIKNKNPASNLL